MRRHDGFTLIELVIILILAGILCAVGAAKYFDLSQEAEHKAAMQTLAEAQARLQAVFGQQLLAGENCAAARTSAMDFQKLADEGAEIRTSMSASYGNIALRVSAWPETLTTEKVAVEYKNVTDGNAVWGALGELALPQCDTVTQGAMNPVLTPEQVKQTLAQFVESSFEEFVDLWKDKQFTVTTDQSKPEETLSGLSALNCLVATSGGDKDFYRAVWDSATRQTMINGQVFTAEKESFAGTEYIVLKGSLSMNGNLVPVKFVGNYTVATQMKQNPHELADKSSVYLCAGSSGNTGYGLYSVSAASAGFGASMTAGSLSGADKTPGGNAYQ